MRHKTPDVVPNYDKYAIVSHTTAGGLYRYSLSSLRYLIVTLLNNCNCYIAQEPVKELSFCAARSLFYWTMSAQRRY